MKSSWSFRSLAAVFILGIMLSTMFTVVLPVFDQPEMEEEVQLIEPQTREDITGTGFIPVNLFCKESYGLNPREAQVNDFDLEQACPNGYVGDGMFGLGIVTMFGHVYWKNVGTWKTNELRTELVISGKIKYSLWLYQRSGRQDGDFRVSLLSNDKEIAGTRKEFHNFWVEETPQELIIEFDAGGNITPLQPGDILSMKIECRMQAGAYLYYGGPTFKSGVSITCNSLQVPEPIYDSEQKALRAQLSDAFGMSPALMTPTLLIDDNIADLEYNLGLNAETFNWELTYFLYLLENLREGEHVATVVFAYSRASPVNVTASLAFRYVPFKESAFSKIQDFLDPATVCPILFLIGVIVGTIVVLGQIKKRRRKKGLSGYVGKPGGFWDKQRQKRAAKKAIKQRKKDDKKRQKDLKKQSKGRKRR